MIRRREIAAFLGLAVMLHGGVWFGLNRAGSESSGASGQAVVSLEAVTGEIGDLVEAWSRPVDAMRSRPTLPTANVPDVTLASPPPQYISAPSPRILPPLNVTTGSHSLDLAPRVFPSRTQPAAKPDTSPQSLDPPTKVETTPAKPIIASPRKPSAQPQAAGRAARTATGNKSGVNAGEKKTQHPATLSEGARKKLLSRWGASIRNRVDRQKRYPRGTRAYGTTVLRITVTRTGRLVGVTVAKSSGDTTLDSAAISAVQRARFPAAPKGLEAEQYRFNLPLAFSKN